MADIQFPQTRLFAPCTFVAVVNDNNGDPSNVLDAGMDFTIRTTTDLSDDAANRSWAARSSTAAYVESIGPAPSSRSAPPCPGRTTAPRPFDVDIVVKADTLPNNLPPGHSGAYKLVVLLTHRDNAGRVGDVAAIVDGPVLRIS